MGHRAVGRRSSTADLVLELFCGVDVQSGGFGCGTPGVIAFDGFELVVEDFGDGAFGGLAEEGWGGAGLGGVGVAIVVSPTPVPEGMKFLKQTG